MEIFQEANVQVGHCPNGNCHGDVVMVGGVHWKVSWESIVLGSFLLLCYVSYSVTLDLK